ncbi:MAG: cbb3-type cytochrome c oxidase subunit 3 [Magnetococcales bacterium]|nr:cbb3-type cytochrome c oxidase subunit 3 [Magnetococcales bacterium]
MNFADLFAYSKIFALLWFFLAFVGVVLWAYWPAHKKRFDEAALKILRDDEDIEQNHPSPPSPKESAPPPG